MNAVDWAETLICSDCVNLHANGEMPADATPERLAELEAIDQHFVLDSDDEGDPFNTCRCGSCGTGLAGYRHLAYVEVLS